MNDIFDAVERLTAVLSFTLQRVAGQRGWAAKPFSMVIAPSPARHLMLVATTVTLPGHLSAGFSPLYQADEGGKAWTIDVRRTDGVVRDTWANGLTISKSDGKFQIMNGAIALSDDSLQDILEDLGTP